MEVLSRRWIVWLVTLAFVRQMSAIRCPSLMRGLEQCECGGSSGIYEVICKDLGHETHEALESLALVPHVNKLVYTGNNISELAANIFGDCSRVRLTNLTYVDLSNNGIRVIHGQSFHCAPNVRVLKLDDNRWHVDRNHVRVFSSMPHLEELHLNNAFPTDGSSPPGSSTISLRSVFNGSHMVALRRLYLEKNGIEFVDRRTFCQLPNLEELYLSDNRLTKLDLDCLDRLRHLYVRNNSIPWLSRQDITSLQEKRYLSVLDLHDNPFQCTDCSDRTSYFRDWLTGSAKFVVDKSRLKCTNGRLVGKAITSLTDQDLRGMCPKPRHSKKSRSQSTGIITGVILGIIGLLMIVFLYVNRDSIKKSVSRWIRPIQNSAVMKRVHFGYTNMNSENSSPTVATL